MSSDERTVYGMKAPLRLVASHDIAQPGFQSVRRGEFVLMGASSQDASTEIVLRDLTILGVPLAKFVLQSPSGDTRLLQVDFDRAMTEADAFSFIRRLADAWSATLADGQRDPWYGNLYVDIRWAGVKTITAQSGGVQASVQMTSIENVRCRAGASVRLAVVAAHRRVRGGYESVATEVEVPILVLDPGGTGEAGGVPVPVYADVLGRGQGAVAGRGALRTIWHCSALNGLLNNPTTTLEGRAAKLARIVEMVGGSSIDGLSGPFLVDQARCAALIEQRNKVAHKGSSIDKDLLYTVLFPLSRIALKCILDRDAGTASEPQT